MKWHQCATSGEHPRAIVHYEHSIKIASNLGVICVPETCSAGRTVDFPDHAKSSDMTDPLSFPSINRRTARRFPIRTPILFRSWNEVDWHHGTTENISSSGVYFRCEQPAEYGMRLEVGFVLPSALRGGSGARVACTGEVVRVEQSQETGVSPALALRIMFSQLRPWKDSEERINSSNE